MFKLFLNLVACVLSFSFITNSYAQTPKDQAQGYITWAEDAHFELLQNINSFAVEESMAHDNRVFAYNRYHDDIVPNYGTDQQTEDYLDAYWLHKNAAVVPKTAAMVYEGDAEEALIEAQNHFDNEEWSDATYDAQRSIDLSWWGETNMIVANSNISLADQTSSDAEARMDVIEE